MMDYTNEEMNRIAYYMDGNWLYEDQSVRIEIGINKFENVSIITTREGKTASLLLSANVHWYYNFLCFTHNNMQYYLSYADKEKMIFGEFLTPGEIGQVKWQYTFIRI